MHEDEIRNLVVEAGESMPASSRTAIRASLAAALAQTPVREKTGEVPSAEPATTNVVTLRPSEPSDTRRRGAHGRRSRWIALIGAGAVAAAAVGVLLVRRESQPASITGTVPTAPSNPTSSPTSAPGTTQDTTTPDTSAPGTGTPNTSTPPTAPPPTTPTGLPDGATLPVGVGVESISFPTVTDGWVVGHRDDGSVSFQHTTDGGVTWTEVAPPAELAAAPGTPGGSFAVTFADARNGWLNGPGRDSSNVLLATHDGGASWASITLASAAEPVQVAVGAGHVHVLSFDQSSDSVAFRIYTAPVGSDDFTVSPVTISPGAGPVFDAQFAFGGDRGWLVYNDRVFSGSARYVDGAWLDWHAACTTDQVASVAASPDGATVLVACNTSTFVNGTAAPALAVSTDGGVRFTATSPLPKTSTTDLAGFVSTVLFAVVPEPDVLVVGYLRAYGEVGLTRSTDAGRTWTEPDHPGLSPDSAAVLATRVGSGPEAPIVIAASGNAIVSVDAGATWTALAGLANRSGELAQIDFTTGQIFGFDAGFRDGITAPNPEQVLAAVEPVLGPASLDTGWYVVPAHPDSSGADCFGGGEFRVLIWGDLSMLFVDKATNGGRLMDWQLDPTFPARGIDLVVAAPAPYPTGITSTDAPAIGFGGSFAALVAAHPEYADRFGGTSSPLYVEVGDDGDTLTRIAVENGC